MKGAGPSEAAKGERRGVGDQSERDQGRGPAKAGGRGRGATSGTGRMRREAATGERGAELSGAW